MSVHKLAENYFVTGQISASNLQAIKEMGFKAIICNRPDGEGFMQPSFEKLSLAAAEHGLAMKYLPVRHGPIQPSEVQNLGQALEELEGPVLAYCASGARSANLWKHNESISGNAAG
jgi:sulfide:quinone oxidoreductase